MTRSCCAESPGARGQGGNLHAGGDVRGVATISPGTELVPSGNTRLMGDHNANGGSDAELILQSLSAPELFATIFERHSAPVHRYLALRFGPGSAEDLLGETFVTAFRSRLSFDLGRPDARPWLFGIATNVARHHWRSEMRRADRDQRLADLIVPEADLSDVATDTALFQSQRDKIAWALSRIDGQFLEVLLLVAGPGFSYEEVAEALHIPVGTVRSRLARARRQLRELLGTPGQYLDGVSLDEVRALPEEGSR
jgi:RNA polymerase sigma factor (sigma-70 family)